MRNSTCKPDFRELSDGVRQQKECLELTSERLSKIFYIIRGGYKNQMVPYPASV